MISVRLPQKIINHIPITINPEETILSRPPLPSIEEPHLTNIHSTQGISIKFLFKNLFRDMSMRKESILGQEAVRLLDLRKVLKNLLTDIQTLTSHNKISNKQKKYISVTTHLTQIQTNSSTVADHLETTMTKIEE